MFSTIASFAFTTNLIFALLGIESFGTIGLLLSKIVQMICSIVITLYATKRIFMSVYCVVGLLIIWGIILYINPNVPEEDHPITTLYGVSEGLTELEKAVITENSNTTEQMKYIWRFRYNIPYYPIFSFWKNFGYITRKSYDGVTYCLAKLGLINIESKKTSDETTEETEDHIIEETAYETNESASKEPISKKDNHHETENDDVEYSIINNREAYEKYFQQLKE